MEITRTGSKPSGKDQKSGLQEQYVSIHYLIPIMRMIHNGGENHLECRYFFPKELEFKWLDPNLTDNDLKNIIDYEIPSEELSYYTVASIRSKAARVGGRKK